MSDSLASVRRALRHLKSLQRKDLKKRMDGYNGLARKAKTPDDLYDLESAKTTQDVVEETIAIRNKDRSANGGARFSVSSSRQDHLFREASIVQPEVRDAWHARCNMVALLTDDVKQKLIQQSGRNAMALLRSSKERDEYLARETRLDTLAHWMVWMWCEGEGYDPDKHPKHSQ